MVTGTQDAMRTNMLALHPCKCDLHVRTQEAPASRTQLQCAATHTQGETTVNVPA